MAEVLVEGKWKILSCTLCDSSHDSRNDDSDNESQSNVGGSESQIEGTIFELEGGDITWIVKGADEGIPFFTCETYEVIYDDDEDLVLKFIGAVSDYKIDFNVELEGNNILLICDRCCTLHCTKIFTKPSCDDAPFSLLPALMGEHFSDLQLLSQEGHKFLVHKVILAARISDWTTKSTPLDGLPADVLKVILHYCYADCLPEGLSEESASRVLEVASHVKGLDSLKELCETFLQNTALTNQLMSLINDIHLCAERIIDMFSGKISEVDGLEREGGAQSTKTEAQGGFVADSNDLKNNPAKLCHVCKEAGREIAVALSKCMIVCELFAQRKSELPRTQRHEIISYIKSRIPILMEQLKRFLEICKARFGDLSADERREIASYMISEVDQTLELLKELTGEGTQTMESVVKHSEDTMKKSKSVTGKLGKTIKYALHVKELKKLKKLQNRFSKLIQAFLEKRETYLLFTDEHKIRALDKSLEQLLDELPYMLERLGRVQETLDRRSKYLEFKYLFKLGSAKVAWLLHKFQLHRDKLSGSIAKANDMVNRDAFRQSLTTLRLLPVTMATTQTHKPGKYSSEDDVKSAQLSRSSGIKKQSKDVDARSDENIAGASSANNVIQPNKYAQLASVESLCRPPLPKSSLLAKRLKNMLGSEEHADMNFELVQSEESGDVVIDHVKGTVNSEEQTEYSVTLVPAHRVIVAARCERFRKALLSGMKESIDRKITVHDACHATFLPLLEFIYTGEVDLGSCSADQLCELLHLSDRYELDRLKHLCGTWLQDHMTEDSCLPLLSVAHRYRVDHLRARTMAYIVNQDHDVLDKEEYRQLPVEVREELDRNLRKKGKSKLHSRNKTCTPPIPPPKPEHFTLPDLTLADSSDESAESTDSEVEIVEDGVLLENCLLQLRDIIGPEVPDDELVPIIRAADFDANRALNYYFSQL